MIGTRKIGRDQLGLLLSEIDKCRQGLRQSHEEEIGDTGLIKSAQSMHYEQLLTNVLFVVDLGEMCYSDKERFPSGPWCKKGDFIMCRANTGTRFKIHGTEFRLINDDSVEAVVEDPRGIERVN